LGNFDFAGLQRMQFYLYCGDLQMSGFVIQTKMAAAMSAAFAQCVKDGENPGRVGHRILTNNAKGHGVKNAAAYLPKPKVEEKKESKAESAVLA
jgi:hypothetical protein